MLDMSINDAIIGIVEGMMPKGISKDLGLYIELDLRDQDFDSIDEKSAATIVKFIIQRPNNYTRVLVNYKFNNFHESFTDPIVMKRYEEFSYHDSGWRSDGMTILSHHWHQVNDYFEVHPSKLHNHYTFKDISFIRFFQFNKVEETAKRVEYDVSFEKLRDLSICQWISIPPK